jgi:transposase
MEVTIDQLKEAIRKQTQEVEEMIARAKDKYKNEEDPKYSKRISTLELVRESIEQVLNLNWDEVSQKDIQTYYNVLLSHRNKFQNSN